MLVGRHDALDLVDRFGSPLFVYDFKAIRDRYADLRHHLHPGIKLYYAVKANPNPAVVRQFAALGTGFDVSSRDEMRVALQQGGDPKEMSFAGPGKTDADIAAAVSEGIGMLSVESINELRTVAEYARTSGTDVNMTIRVNPGHLATGFSIKMGGLPSQFGVDEEFLPEVAAMTLTQPQVSVTGLHVFSGTQSLDEQAIVANTEYTFALAERCRTEHQLDIQKINLGGGFGVPYHDGERELDLKEVTRGINRAAERYLKRYPETALVIELGRYLVARSGQYVTTVIRTKRSRETEFLVLDGGMNHYLAASGNLGQVLRRNFPLVHASKTDDQGTRDYHVVGPLCTTIDRMATSLELPFTDEGDRLVFPMAGAYAYTASPLQFLSHPAPAEVAVDGEQVTVIRDRQEQWDVNVSAARDGMLLPTE